MSVYHWQSGGTFKRSTRAVAYFAAAAFAMACLGPAFGAQRKTLSGNIPAVVSQLAPIGRMNPNQRLPLAIGLPVRDPAGLAQFLEDLYDPANPQFHRYLTPEEFTARFGPTEASYQAVVDFAQTHGLAVKATHPNRMLLDVEGAVADIEQALHVNMQVYQHPTEARVFFSADQEPTIDAGVGILDICGLNNHTRPHPASLHKIGAPAIPQGGGGTGGSYKAYDIRQAYALGVTLTGLGQSVGLLEFDGFYTNDIATYRNICGVHNIPLVTVAVSGFNGVPSTTNSGNSEVALDIEMAMAMAPGLKQILVYEADPLAGFANDMLSRMLSDNAASQISSSWTFGTTPNATTDQLFQQMAAQGQSFSNASGDVGAELGTTALPISTPSDSPYIVSVGGTTLSTTGPGGTRVSEMVWNAGGASSSGGSSSHYAIPSWQKPVTMTSNLGSTAHRNFPDIAFLADNVLAVADQGNQEVLSGTSVASPLWAAFLALVNQKAAAANQARVGFVNPALYRVALSSLYTTAIHDITSGNNQVSGSGTRYSAVAGFDLCTGWGTPVVQQLANALYLTDALGVTPNAGAVAYGAVGGPFNLTSVSYALTNSTTGTNSWALGGLPAWLDASSTSGAVFAGGPATFVTLTLNGVASSLTQGSYLASIGFTNINTGFVQSRTFTLHVGQTLVQNGGFETADFTYWTLSGAMASEFNVADDSLPNSGAPHSGRYFAALGQNLSLTDSRADLTQTLPTVPGQSYVYTYWLLNVPDTTGATAPNEFISLWNTNILAASTNAPASNWTQYQFVVTANSEASLIDFHYSNDPGDWGLDDVSLLPIPTPTITSLSLTPQAFSLQWLAQPGATYQVQSAPGIAPATWTNVGSPQTAAQTSLSYQAALVSTPDQFYRVVLVTQ